MITERNQTLPDRNNFHHSQVDNMELKKRMMPAEGVEKDKGNDITENGEGDENHNEIQVEEYNNCTHGDLADYTCVECLYNRWRSQANIKKPVNKEDSVVVIDDDDAPGILHG